jgi:sulfur-carrier protein
MNKDVRWGGAYGPSRTGSRSSSTASLSTPRGPSDGTRIGESLHQGVFVGETGPSLDVHLDGWLRQFGPRGKETVSADSVEHLLDELEGRYPRLRFKLRDETGQLRRYVRVFVDGEDVSRTTGTATRLSGAETIDILHSIAGG